MDGQVAGRSRKFDPQSSFIGGISDDEKKNLPFTYGFGRSVNIRSNSREIKLLPKTSKESGSIIVDLPKWADRVGDTVYIYGDDGNIYTRSLAGSYTNARTVANSSGNGLKYYGEDRFLYYTSDKLVGRYGPSNGTPAFTDDFLGSEGGVPLNTHAIDFESSSSQYATCADSASLSVTSDLSMDVYIKLESLPTVGNSMTIASKWDESGTLRSYMFDVYAISGFFGDGSDSTLTISADTTDSNTQKCYDSACTGTSGSISLAATNASFSAGQAVLIHQTRGAGAGTKQRNKISSYTAGTVTLETALNADYVSGAQIRVLPQYTDVIINSGKTYTAKAWNGTVGGILAFLSSGTVTITGSIKANGGNGTTDTGYPAGGTGGGFRGGDGSIGGFTYCGEGTAGPSGYQATANGNGGGGGNQSANSGAGGAGGNGTAGSNGTSASGSGGSGTGGGGSGGGTAGSADLTTLVFGGGGGGCNKVPAGTKGSGASGGGIIYIAAVTLSIGGAIQSNGGVGGDTGDANTCGGSGAGGSILLQCQSATLGVGLITASGGSSGNAAVGGSGRVHLDYYTSYTGTSTPTLDVAQDNTLVTTTSYQLRLSLSTDGTNPERLTKNVDITTATFYRVGFSWDASDHEVEFFFNGASIGTSVGSITSIHDNASVFAVARYKNGAGTGVMYFDGVMDDLRLFNTERTAAQMFNNKDVEIPTNSPGLAAYYKFNNNADDSSSNANNLTPTNTPTYTTTVPFASPTARLDLDQSLDTSGDTYALATAISETAAHRQTFVPAKDPQKSIEINVSDTGDDSDWTLTVHDALNRVQATATITHANLHTGDVEFTFSSVWRPVIGASYHFHLTATTTTGTPLVVSTSSNDLETGDFHTYYQFMVEDENHPIEQILNLLALGNERYLATWNGGTYNPHRLTLPAGYRIRCLTKWQGFLAIGCTLGTNIYSYDYGIIFFWDGISPTYNDYIVVPQGAINAMSGSQGTLTFVAGYQGDVLEYTGGPKARKVKRIPKITPDKYIEILPGAMTNWQALLRIGVGVTDSSVIEQGAYTLGQLDDGDPMALSYDFPISTGTRTNSNIKIGLLFPVEKKLLMGWKNNVSYGVDVVDPAGSVFATGTVERLIADYGAVYKDKAAMVVRADIKSLATGESVAVKYKLDRGEWVSGGTTTSDGLAVRLPIAKGRHKELQIAADLATSVSTSPTVLELSVEEEVLATEAAH